MACITPLPGLGQRSAQHPYADAHNLAAALCHRDEFGRTDSTQLGVRPAQQGLHAHQSPILQPDSWLVVQCQLAQHQSTGQGVLYLQHPERPGLHVRREEPVGVTPGLFGTEHRRIGALRQGLEVSPILGVHRNTEGRSHHQLVVLQLADTAHLRLQLIGHMGCLLRIGEGQHDHELIPALPRHRVFIAHHRLQSVCDLDQQAVPYLVTERVVHILEVIQVQVQQRELMAAALRQCKGLAEPGREHRAVGQARQRIEVDQLADAFLITTALRHVFLHGQIVGDAALFVMQWRDDGDSLYSPPPLRRLTNSPRHGRPDARCAHRSAYTLAGVAPALSRRGLRPITSSGL